MQTFIKWASANIYSLFDLDFTSVLLENISAESSFLFQTFGSYQLFVENEDDCSFVR